MTIEYVDSRFKERVMADGLAPTANGLLGAPLGLRQKIRPVR
jgi:hypothetical protein